MELMRPLKGTGWGLSHIYTFVISNSVSILTASAYGVNNTLCLQMFEAKLKNIFRELMI